jgi:hypothetical protein
MADFVSIANFVVTLCLAVLTAGYVLLTKRLVDAASRQTSLAANPVVGLRIEDVHIGDKFGPGRQQMNVACFLTNIGNSPAINVFTDAEIELLYATDVRKIPARFDPEFVAFVKPNEETRVSLNFGHKAVAAIIADLRAADEKNFKRIQESPEKEPFTTSMLRVFVYYNNSLGVQFKTFYEAHLGCWHDEGGWRMPERDEDIRLVPFYIPKPRFYVGLAQPGKVEDGLRNRNRLRDLSGW